MFNYYCVPLLENRDTLIILNSILVWVWPTGKKSDWSQKKHHRSHFWLKTQKLLDVIALLIKQECVYEGEWNFELLTLTKCEEKPAWAICRPNPRPWLLVPAKQQHNTRRLKTQKCVFLLVQSQALIAISVSKHLAFIDTDTLPTRPSIKKNIMRF